jgi:hypothetical protein
MALEPFSELGVDRCIWTGSRCAGVEFAEVAYADNSGDSM